ncbi:MAG: Zn finger-containing GTPase- Activating Protein for ARF, partial [Alyxoria varia]
SGERAPTFHPEFGRFMLEATPGKPWGIEFKDLLAVEPNMKWRRRIAKEHMADTESPVTMTTYPLLGLSDTLIPDYPVSGERLRSQFVPDEIANPHIRFPTLAANIRARRGRKVEVNVPVFRDEKTPWPFKDPTVNYDLHNWPEDDDVRRGAAKDNEIHMDAMAFGMGSCCLQITFQAKNIEEGRKMYDQLSPLGPILLALTATTPIYKGFLVDTDVRWNQISNAVDDRTPEELGEEDPRLRKEYFDPDLIVDPALKQRLLDGGMDELLAAHFAHLFIRDPIVIFAEDLQELDLSKADHFENLQSTNWQHMRFKPPPPGNDTGWRVEFRPMEIQMTDFENAAFAIFIVLITRAILSFDLNFYIPIPRVTDNMQTAHSRDAVLNEKFYFRKDPFPPATGQQTSSSTTATSNRGNGLSSMVNGVNAPREDVHDTIAPQPANGSVSPELGPVEDEYSLMTIDEIINGQKAPSSPNIDPNNTPPFPGLIPLVESYLSSVNIDVETRCALARYLDLIRRRASGGLKTGARWMREFVAAHPDYHKDSKVDPGVAYDICSAVEEIAGTDWEKLGRKGGRGRTGWEMFVRQDNQD